MIGMTRADRLIARPVLGGTILAVAIFIGIDALSAFIREIDEVGDGNYTLKMYVDKYKDYPHWEADRAYFAMQVFKAGVEAAQKAKNAWPGKEDIISAMEGVKVQSLGGPGHMRKDHIAEQTFYQGLTTHKNGYDFPTLGTVDTMYSDRIQKPPGGDFWKWIETAQIKL